MKEDTPKPSSVKLKIVSSDADKRIPKCCTNTLFNKQGDDKIFLTFLATERIPTSDGAFIDEGIIIERVLIDKEQAKQIAEKLNEMIKDSPKK